MIRLPDILCQIKKLEKSKQKVLGISRRRIRKKIKISILFLFENKSEKSEKKSEKKRKVRKKRKKWG